MKNRPYFLVGVFDGEGRYIDIFNDEKELEEFMETQKTKQGKIKVKSVLGKADIWWVIRYYIPESFISKYIKKRKEEFKKSVLSKELRM